MGEKPQLRLGAQFEYTVRFRGGGQPLESVLNPAGEAGWELCVLAPNPPNSIGLDSGDKLVFKRRKVAA